MVGDRFESVAFGPRSRRRRQTRAAAALTHVCVAKRKAMEERERRRLMAQVRTERIVWAFTRDSIKTCVANQNRVLVTPSEPLYL